MRYLGQVKRIHSRFESYIFLQYTRSTGKCPPTVDPIWTPYRAEFRIMLLFILMLMALLKF